MVVEIASWEHQLLVWAREALASPAVENVIAPAIGEVNSAYEYCSRITQANSRTFHMASALLPHDKRRAARALYAFCRSTDDMVDKLADKTQADRIFENWRARLANPHPAANDPVPLAWADAQARFRIPHGYAEQLIKGVSRDLAQTRYQTFDELTEYCYGVASTVGLMVMHIIGFRNQDALPYAVKLGIALQLTNILRDVGDDWRAGRLYLPLDELAAFGLTENDIAAARIDDRWRAFMHFQIERVERLYTESEQGIAYLHADGRFAIATAAELYRAILQDIRAHDFDVFHRRAHIGLGGKLSRLPRIWWNSRVSGGMYR
jgi:phytoene synthase